MTSGITKKQEYEELLSFLASVMSIAGSECFFTIERFHNSNFHTQAVT